MFSLFHFNDIYNIEGREKEPVGGASRFSSLVKKLRGENPDMKVCFGGDALSPSLISSVTCGKHIPPIFNELGVDISVCGNHDFDFGTDRLQQIKNRCNFPWLLANIVYTTPDGEEKNLSDTLPYKVETINGVKVGFIGLAEEEWLACLTKLPETTKYKDQAEVGKKIATSLREEGCQIIVGMTHSREPQDTYLAKNCPDIDIILGGHDHDYYIRFINGIPILHSGCEFRQATLIKIHLKDPSNKNHYEDVTTNLDTTSWMFEGRRAVFELQKFEITSEIPKDPKMEEILVTCNESVQKKMKKILGESESDWDVTFKHCRLQENNIGNFISDLMREAYKTDFALICGGTLRSNDNYPAGWIKMGDIMKILPFPDTVTVAEIKGKYLVDALENGFSAFPNAEGRFPQISGGKIEFDPNNPPGKRIKKFEIDGAPVESEKVYTLATKPYLLKGGDGYEALKNFEKLIVDDEGIPLATLLRNHFVELKVLNAISRKQRISELVKTAFNPDAPLPSKYKANPQIDGRIKILS